MAAIDKIYGTMEQRDELENWLTENLPAAIPYLYPPWENGGYGPISNFPSWVDKALWSFCPLEWVRERLKEQYYHPDNI